MVTTSARCSSSSSRTKAVSFVCRSLARRGRTPGRPAGISAKIPFSKNLRCAPTTFNSRFNPNFTGFRGANMASEKKRKRQEEAGAGSTKKAAGTPGGSVQVQYVDNSDVSGPVLGMQHFYNQSVVCTMLMNIQRRPLVLNFLRIFRSSRTNEPKSFPPETPQNCSSNRPTIPVLTSLRAKRRMEALRANSRTTSVYSTPRLAKCNYSPCEG